MSQTLDALTDQQAQAIAKATLYALRCGCFFPVLEPLQGCQTQDLIQWGAMQHLHAVIAEELR